MKTKTKLIRPTAAEDARINAGIAADPDNPELTDEFFAKAKKPAKEFFDANAYKTLQTTA